MSTIEARGVTREDVDLLAELAARDRAEADDMARRIAAMLREDGRGDTPPVERG